MHAPEGAQLLAGTGRGSHQVADIDLHHLVAVHGAGIGDVHRHLAAGRPVRFAQGDTVILSASEESRILIFKSGIAEAIAEGIQRGGALFHVVVAVGDFAVVVHGQLSHAAVDAHAQASGVVVSDRQDIGQSLSALASGVPEGEEGVGLVGCPVLVQGAAFDVHHHERLAGCLERLEQGHLQAQQVQRAAVEAFAGLHVGDGRLVHHGGACVNVLGLEVAGR